MAKGSRSWSGPTWWGELWFISVLAHLLTPCTTQNRRSGPLTGTLLYLRLLYKQKAKITLSFGEGDSLRGSDVPQSHIRHKTLFAQAGDHGVIHP